MLYFHYSYFSGCYCKAQHFGSQIAKLIRLEKDKEMLNDPYKHFIYGSFFHSFDTIYGVLEVNWGWHVAPMVKVGTDLYILDPLMGHKPLKKDEYHRMLEVEILNTRGSISGYVTCRPDTYDNADDCFNPHRFTSLQTFEMETKLFLDL